MRLVRLLEYSNAAGDGNVKTNYYRIAIMGALTMEPSIRTVEQLRAATDRVLAKPTEDPTLNLLVRAVEREHVYMSQLVQWPDDRLGTERTQKCLVAMDRTWIAVQFLVAQANRESVRCADCGQPIERPTDATVRWIGDDARDEREILHAHGDMCVTAMVRDVA
jgi:hypothetical protein